MASIEQMHQDGWKLIPVAVPKQWVYTHFKVPRGILQYRVRRRQTSGVVWAIQDPDGNTYGQLYDRKHAVIELQKRWRRWYVAQTKL